MAGWLHTSRKPGQRLFKNTADCSFIRCKLRCLEGFDEDPAVFPMRLANHLPQCAVREKRREIRRGSANPALVF